MMRESYTMHHKVVAYLVEIVHEESVPVNIEIGSKHKDYNGDTQMNVLLEYEEKDEAYIGKILTTAVNHIVNLC